MSDEINNGVPESASENYSASKITVLEGLEAVRVRPSMYIGDTGERGLHHLVYEVVDNSIDEALAGYASHVTVSILPGNAICVIDDGRGIPVDMHPTEHKPAIEVVLTILHAGGKFDHNSYKVSGGLHGVGVSCVNALSNWMEVEVCRDGGEFNIRFERGKTVRPLQRAGDSTRRGTKVTFMPDDTIFNAVDYKWNILADRMRELAFLNPGITINLNDERNDAEHPHRSETYHYAGGIREFVQHLNKEKTVLHQEVIYFHRAKDGIDVEVAFQYNDGSSELILSYTNNIHTIEGGTHLVGFQAALTRTINAYAKASLKNDRAITGPDSREGISAVISVKVPDPQFEGQTKTKLGNSAVRGIVESVINEELATYFEENPAVAQAICKQAMLALDAREAANRARMQVKRKGALEGFSLPGKLADCSSKDPSQCEIYIVEGDSAGGSAKQGRNSTFQAVLPIRGKLLNVEKARIDKVFDNKEIQSLIAAVGCGFGDEFDVSKARYHRVVIMTDADVDGSHIRTLLLTFFYRQMKPLIEAGYVYIANPPLFKVTRGKKEQYIDTEEQLDKYLLQLGIDDIAAQKTDGTSLTREEITELLALHTRSQHLSAGLNRCGIMPKDYFQNVREDGKCPIRHITVRELNGDSTASYVYSEEEGNAIISAARERLRGSDPVPEAGSEAEQEFNAFVNRNLDIIDIFEAADCDVFVKDLAAKGLKPEQLYIPSGAIFNLQSPGLNEGRSVEIETLEGFFQQIRLNGQNGLKIQRYKGLGEMNPAQLRDTTMDPASRKMIRVTMQDVVEAERLFNLLMGDVVEPRREYIEKYAAGVKDLDI